jgi:hypothetical protein
MRPWLLLLLWGLAGVLPAAVAQVTRCTFTRADILAARQYGFGQDVNDNHRPYVFTVTAPFPNDGQARRRRDAARAVFNLSDVSVHHVISQKSLKDWTADWITNSTWLAAVAEGFTWLAGNITARQAQPSWPTFLYPINQNMNCSKQLGTWVWESFMWVSRVAAFVTCLPPCPWPT